VEGVGVGSVPWAEAAPTPSNRTIKDEIRNLM
jgi:hypothetical protein